MHSLFGFFLSIKSEECRKLYTAYQRSHLKLTSIIPNLFCVLYMYFQIPENQDSKILGKFYYIFGSFYSILSLLYMYSIFVEQYLSNNDKFNIFKILSGKILNRYFLGSIESFIAITSSVSLGINHICIILDLQSIPADIYVVNLISNIVYIVFYPGICFPVFILSFVISFLSYLLSLVILEDVENNYFQIISFIFVFAISFELQMTRLSEFFNHRSPVFNNRKKKPMNSDEETKNIMIRYLSHEIRSPLNVVINGLTFVYGDLKSGKESISDSLDIINDIKHAASSAVTILDNFLDYEKMQSSIFMIEQDWFPSSVLIELINFHKIFPKEKGIEFNITNNIYESLRLYIDEIKIEQIIRNLIVNSTKFTAKGGSININLRFEKESDNRSDAKNATGLDIESIPFQISYYGTIFVDIIDSGVGISVENSSKIFNQFSQIDNKNLQGIFLYIYMINVSIFY